MDAKAYFRNIHISPKKLRFLLPEVKKMSPAAAVDFLNYTPKSGAKILRKALNSVMSTARNSLKVGDDLLEFKLLTIEEGQKIKRFRAGSKGAAKPIKRRYAHIKIILTAKEGATKK